MKRIAIVLALVAGGFTPVWSLSALRGYQEAAPLGRILPTGGALPTDGPSGAFCDAELPWSTVSAVLEAVSDRYPYSYSQLVDWYQVGLVAVEQSGSGYQVTVADEDGIVEVLVIDDL